MAMKNTNILSELYKGLIGVKSWLSRGFVLILALFTLGFGQVWASTTFADGDVLLYDFSDVTGGGGVNWQVNGSTMVYDPAGAGTIKCVIFTSSTTWTTSWTVAKTAKGGWANINMPSDRPSGKNCIKIGSDGKTASWTTISLAEKVAAGDFIMVYGGELSSWNQSSYYFIGSNSNTTDNTKAFANANKAITIDSEAYKFGPAALPSATYIQGHWASNLSCTIAAGCAYVVRGSTTKTTYYEEKAKNGDNYIYRVKKQSATAPTTTLTPTYPLMIKQGEKLSFTPGAAGVSVLGNTNSIKYYLKNGSTYTEKTLSDGKLDVSSLPAGEYQIITLLFDGYIYVKASTSTFTIEPTHAVTINNDGHGTTSPSGAQSSVGEVTGIAISADPNDDYEFVNWTLESGTGSFGDANDESTTFYPTSAATIRANFRSTVTNSLTVSAGTHVTTVTGSTSPVTLGNKYAINATAFETGWQFLNWTATPTANGTFDNASSASTNVTVKNGSVTVTANAREIMRSITISGGHVYGGATTSTTAGVATSAKITANDPATGKKFTGWSLGSGVSLKGGYALTDQTIEIYSTANATVTATYADRAQVKMYFAKPTNLSWSKVYAYAWGPSGHNATYPGVELENTEVINCVTYYTYQYYTESDGIGGAATGDATWNKIVFGDNNDGRKTGDLNIANGHYYYRATEANTSGKAAAITSAWYIKGTMNSWGEIDPITHNCATNSGSVNISLTGGQDYQFKVYNEVNDQMWSNSTAHGSSNKISASMASATTLYNNDANTMYISTALTGSYTFTVGSTNAANPTIKVTFPEVYAVVGSFNSWNSETNPLAMDGNTGTADIVLTPSDANYTLKVVDNGAMYGKNSTNITATTTVSGMVVGQSNINLKADIYPASANPLYRFSYNKSTKALTVTYPAAHTVTYGVGTHAGTASVTSSISVASGKKILDAQSITFSKGGTNTGYTWKGWYNNADGSSSALGTGDTYTSSSRAANTSVYACYNLVNYTITYNLNGGANPVSPAPATGFTIESSAITLPTPTKTGYTFAGWKENSNLSGDTHTTIPASSTGNKVYYAKWTPITYTVTYNANGGTGTTDNSSHTYDATKVLTSNGFSKTGYTFGGWATSQANADAGTVAYTDGQSVSNLSSTQGATVELFAIWTPNDYTVTLSQTGADVAGSQTSVTGTYNADMPAISGAGKLPTAPQGYAFMGYWDAANGNGTQYYDRNGTSAHVWDKTTDAALYAYFKKAVITALMRI